METPYFYDYANYVKATVKPSNIQPRDNAVNDYYTRYLLKRAMSVFEWDLPEEWDKDYFLYILYCWGFIGVIEAPEVGIICQQCTLAGRDIYYRPNRIIVTNPYLPKTVSNVEYNLHKNAELIKLQPDYTGLLDVCMLYAARLSYIHEALYMNLINSKLAYVFITDNKSAAQTFKKLFDSIQTGEPAVVAGTKMTDADGKPNWEIFSNNLKNNYIATDLLNDMRAVLNDFCSFVGIPSANTQKRERLITDEVNANNVETETLIDLWETTLNACIDKVNAMFGTSISVRKRYPQEGGAENEVDIMDNVQLQQ